MHHTPEEAGVANAEMHAEHAAPEAIELLPHEICKRELEMKEPSENNERLEELRMAQEEVEKRLAIEESAVEY
ncbi:DNA-directed RNA polymerase II subunit RPB1 [Hordeum vulgare]|nr:DNA-directed RNA polymerase II subunit RPB1 [Hordeum vulgare]